MAAAGAAVVMIAEPRALALAMVIATVTAIEPVAVAATDTVLALAPTLALTVARDD